MSRSIRSLELREVEELLCWAAAEGWNPGLHDARAFYAADPNGFFGAFVDGAMVAAIAAIAYDDAFGFIGLYICHADWRGHGHGKAVWDAGMAYLGDRTIGLDAVPMQRDNYASMGFKAAYDTIHMIGMVGAVPAPIERRSPTQPKDIAGLDRQCFPADRHAFLHHWLAPPHETFVYRADDWIAAYGVLRPCTDGAKLGPLFASNVDGAIALLTARSGLIHIDVPCSQTEFLLTLSALGFSPGFQTTRMYRGPAPAVRLPFVFGVTSLELG
ncbi:GNAT family N-acetyltransferase [Devosia submarina]|uniref:GNAT family N-acetyltransferase n=1 Tax=Devosia submarina TaxID=1173082 RepID=UPI000D3B9742|nr:GNAT family N-acetyltransferase [Devosia submarina]